MFIMASYFYLYIRWKEHLQHFWGKKDLKVTNEADQKVADFLDVTLGLNTGRHMPCIKPNNKPKHVLKNSIHPPCEIKNIPLSINNKLSELSSDNAAFNSAAPVYQKALEKVDAYTN